MTHLTPDELVDAIENELSHAGRVHLAECDDCRQQVTYMSAMFRELRAVDVPEPSPLYWDRFPDRVRRALDSVPVSSPRVSRWFQWPVLAPLGALALLIVALVSAVTPRAGGAVGHDLARAEIGTVAEADTAVDAEARWDMVAALIGDIDIETAAEASVGTAPGTADDVVMQLSAAEQQELLRLLRAELERSGG
jgi:hypothetical protein